MPEKDAAYHIQRCIDSGLWVPGGGDDKDEAEEAGAAGASTTEDDTSKSDDIYEQVD